MTSPETLLYSLALVLTIWAGLAMAVWMLEVLL